MKIHLPASVELGQSEIKARSKESPAGRGEVVLVVEDEPDVRRMAERILSKGGYSVNATSGGEEAVDDLPTGGAADPPPAHRRDHAGDARHRAGRADQGDRPELGVIFMSGYSHEVLAPEALAEQGAGAFIEKPFSAGELLRAVRDLLDGGAAPEDDGKADGS